MIAYQTAWMKANFPVEFMAALLTAEANNSDKISLAVEECRRMGIIVLPPDINLSQADFTLEKNPRSLNGLAIRFGLSAIKNVGEAAIEEIISVRRDGGKFTSLTDLCFRVNSQKVNKKIIESLIKAGAADKFGRRSAMLASLPKIKEMADKRQKEKENGQANLFSNPGEEERVVEDNLVDVEEFPREELLKMERDLLGLYLTEHPLKSRLEQLSQAASHKVYQLSELEQGSVRIAGIISDLRVVTTRNGNKEMAFASVEDETGKIEIVVFPTIFEKSRGLLSREKIVLIEAKVEQREEKTSLIAEKIIDETEEKTIRQIVEPGFVIEIPPRTSPQILVKINTLLKENPGHDQGVIRFPNGKEVKIAFGVNWTPELENEVKKILNLA